MRLAAVAALVQLPETELLDWVARGWVVPAGDSPDWIFAEIDIARVRLVIDLQDSMGIEADSIALLLSLLDQVYDLRRQLAAVLTAAGQQPEPVRAALLAALATARR